MLDIHYDCNIGLLLKFQEVNIIYIIHTYYIYIYITYTKKLDDVPSGYLT